ncbi:MAG: hypothetical protein F6K09_15815 [Merismopedia sp. SIO2A8]|nr:hypothetical protein [Merismopedia sp. SIO2A8]
MALLSLGVLFSGFIAHPITGNNGPLAWGHGHEDDTTTPEQQVATPEQQIDDLSPRASNFPSPEHFPVELEWLAADNVSPGDGVLTSTMISPSGLTPPSLWWTQQQVGGKVLQGWIAYPNPNHAPPYVDLVVNRQLWGLSDYLERYSFVHHFGQAAASFGYSIRVFNNVGDYLAAYPCAWFPPPDTSGSQGVDEADKNEADGDETEDVEGAVDQQPESSSHLRPCSIIVDSSGIGVSRENDFTQF